MSIPALASARAEGGVLWRELDRETQAFGLATTGGTVSNTGIAGLTLGGGLGWLMGKHGLTVDNLLSADVVTADGEFHTVSADREPDLFWALRGGCGNFGVVTSFEYRLHPVGQVLGGLVVYPLDQAARRRPLLPRVLCPPCPTRPRPTWRSSPNPRPACRSSPWSSATTAPSPRARRSWPPPGSSAGRSPTWWARCRMRVRQTLLDEPNARNGLHRYWRSAFAGQLSDEFIDAVVDGRVELHAPR